jgi:hypothetical protein
LTDRHVTRALIVVSDDPSLRGLGGDVEELIAAGALRRLGDVRDELALTAGALAIAERLSRPASNIPPELKFSYFSAQVALALIVAIVALKWYGDRFPLVGALAGTVALAVAVVPLALVGLWNRLKKPFFVTLALAAVGFGVFIAYQANSDQPFLAEKDAESTYAHCLHRSAPTLFTSHQVAVSADDLLAEEICLSETGLASKDHLDEPIPVNKVVLASDDERDVTTRDAQAPRLAGPQ